MIIRDDIQLDYCDVLILPQTTTLNSRSEPNIERTFNFKYSPVKLTGFPLMQANMTQVGTPKMSTLLLKNNCFATIHKFIPAKDIISWMQSNNKTDNVFVTVGIRNFEEELSKLKQIKEYTTHFQILLDVPNAYIPKIHDAVKKLRDNFSDHVIAVGNVATGDETQRLLNDGADIVKVGIGPSPVCDTRIKTGCGRPQLSSVIDCSNAAHQVNGHIIADGGFSVNGDFAKALCAGSDFLMTGSKFAGTDEANGEIISKYYLTGEYNPVHGRHGEIQFYSPIYECKKFKEYYGMSSFRAQQENYGTKTKSGTSEGVECKLIPYVGSAQGVIDDIKGSIRSTCTYVGARRLKDLPRQAIFTRVQRQK